MATPWAIDLLPDRPGGGYRIAGADGGWVRIYGSRADVDLILDSVNEKARRISENLSPPVQLQHPDQALLESVHGAVRQIEPVLG